MPKNVDHEERRREIVMATWRIIASDGLAGTTIREIARETGCSTGVLSHYFTDRQDILTSAMVMAHRGVRERTDAQIRELRGLEALRVMMLESLPLDERRVLEARIEACFWGEAVGNERMMRMQNREVDGFCARIRTRLLEADDDGELEPGTDIDSVVDEMLAHMDGCSIQAVLNPARVPPERQVQRLDALLERIRVPRPAATGARRIGRRDRPDWPDGQNSAPGLDVGRASEIK